MIKHGQVDGNIFELIYNEPFPAYTLSRSAQMILLEIMAYDNQREIEAQKQAHEQAKSNQSDQRFLIGTTSYEEIKFRMNYPDLVDLPVTILTTKEWEALGEPTDHD
jgi:hypothetical protein